MSNELGILIRIHAATAIRHIINMINIIFLRKNHFSLIN